MCIYIERESEREREREKEKEREWEREICIFGGLLLFALLQAAVDSYSAGIVLMPQNHVLWSNRATCFSALTNWRRCQEDAQRVTQLMPDYPKGPPRRGFSGLLRSFVCAIAQMDESGIQHRISTALCYCHSCLTSLMDLWDSSVNSVCGISWMVVIA